MSEILTSRLPIRYDARDRISAHFIDANTIAHSVIPRSAQEGFWPTRSTDPQHAVKVFGSDTANNDRGGGDVPFLAVMDGMTLNTALWDWPGSPDQRPILSLVSDCYRDRTALGRIFAVATISPPGGFQHERFEQASKDMDISQSPATVPPLPEAMRDAGRILHVATIADRMLSPDTGEAQDSTRGLLGAMAAYHALRQLDPETTIQYAYLDDRPGGTYRAVLSQAMGMESDATTLVEHDSNRFVVSYGTVGALDQENTILHSLAAHIEQTHTIS